MRIPFGKLVNLFSPRSKNSFQIELEKEHGSEENVATNRDLQDMLSKCPKDAKITFGLNEGGNVRVLLDTFLHYNGDINEIVLYPFNRPTMDVEMDIPEDENT